MILDELSTYIAANSTLVYATDLFVNQFPATAKDTAVALYETGGVPAIESFGGAVIENPTIQVVTRSTTYPNARDIAQTVYNLMLGVSNSTLSGVSYVSGKGQQSPFSLGEDEDGRQRTSCNYAFQKELSST